MIGAFILRNMRLYFRDRLAVFFSLLSVLIIMAMYLLFLGTSIAGAASEIPAPLAQAFLNSWIMAGILATATVSTTLAAMGTMVSDRAAGIYRDFFVSPIQRSRLALAYILSSVVIGAIMSAILLGLALAYFAANGMPMLPLGNLGALVAWILLSVLNTSALHFLILSRMKSRSAFSSLSTVMGSLLGFMMAIYIPIGQLPSAVQWLIKLFPPSHTAVMLRREMISAVLPLDQVDATSRAFLGIDYQFGSATLQNIDHLAILLVSTTLFFLAAIALIPRKKA